jgi:CRISPR-associated protein Csm1
MDVDNLGKIFSTGLGKEASLSRFASLSFAVNLFFEGRVGYLAQRLNATMGDRVYSIYSGGDDLFFVGSWDAVVEVARQIQADLSCFAAQHPGIHASAGIVLVGGKYPLAQAAQDAAVAENEAKRCCWPDEKRGLQSKNAISFLGRSLPWRTFGLEPAGQEGFETAYQLMCYLLNRKSKLRPLFRRLISFQEMYDERAHEIQLAGRDRSQDGKQQGLWGPWNWLSAYTLMRLARQTKNDDIKTLESRLSKDGFRSIEWIGLAARWAEIATRGEEFQNEHDETENDLAGGIND